MKFMKSILTSLLLTNCLLGVQCDEPRRVIIKYKDDLRLSTQELVLTKNKLREGKQVVMSVNEFGMDVMMLTDDEMHVIRSEEIVKYIEEDTKIYAPTPIPFENRDPLPLSSETTPYGIEMVNATLVDDNQDFEKKVCVIDTGYDVTHPDLPNDVDGTESGQTGVWSHDGHGHGTHCAGTIAAIRGNSQGVVGVVGSGKLPLYIVKIFNDSGSWTSGSNLVQAMETCYEKGANVISMSLGGPFSSSVEESAMNQLFHDHGVLLVAAAGNGGNNAYLYPASYDAVMSVAAIDSSMNRASFSQYNDQVSISAPGVGVLSTLPNNNYDAWSGTSMATPHVAGVAALVWSHHPNTTVTCIRSVLEATSMDLGTPGRDDYYGHGLVDAKAAVDALTAGNACTPQPTPSPSVSLMPSNDCPDGELKFKLEIVGDEYVEIDQSWEVVNNCNEDLVLSGVGSDDGEPTCLDESQSYRFTIYDAWGDGLCCTWGEGSYKVYVDHQLIHSGGEFTYSETTPFGASNCEEPPEEPSECVDSPFKFKYHKLNGVQEWKRCENVTQDVPNACNDHKIKKHCPKTCGFCSECIDSNVSKFKVNTMKKTPKSNKLNCNKVGSHPTYYCQFNGVAETCPEACGVC